MLPDTFIRTATVFITGRNGKLVDEPDVDVVITFRKVSSYDDGVWEYTFTTPRGERVCDGYRPASVEASAYRDVYRTCGMIRRWV